MVAEDNFPNKTHTGKNKNKNKKTRNPWFWEQRESYTPKAISEETQGAVVSYTDTPRRNWMEQEADRRAPDRQAGWRKEVDPNLADRCQG